MPLNRTQGRILWAGAVLVGADAVLMVVRTGPEFRLLVSDLVELAAPLLAALACWNRERHEQGRVALAWQLLAFGCMAWALGQAYWSFDELVVQAGVPVADREVPFPSVADVGYLLFPLLAAASLLILPSRLWRSRARARITADALLMGTALLAACWAAFLRRMVEAFSGQVEVAGLVGFAYPASDAVVLTLAALVGAYAARHERRTRSLLLAGLAAFTLADLLFWMETVNGTYASGSLLDLGWPVGFVLIAMAAGERGPPAALLRLSPEHPGRWARWVPLAPLLIAAAALLGSVWSTGAMDTPIVAMLVFAAGLAMVRELAWWAETRGIAPDEGQTAAPR